MVVYILLSFIKNLELEYRLKNAIKNGIFWSKIEIVIKNPNLSQKSRSSKRFWSKFRFWAKIQILVKNSDFGQ